MKKVKDRFSKLADTYKKYRPTYPRELFDEILELTSEREACWDCGTGNGQVAAQLSPHFKQVFATDISSQQIAKAAKRKNISYSKQRAESTSFDKNQFDLVTVAQAAHWFDMPAFNRELKRVVKNNGLVYVWGYGLLRIDPTINKLIDNFYTKVVGPYWDEERKHVDRHYETIVFDFNEIKSTKAHCIQVSWNLKDLEGYFNSWSSVQNFIAKEDQNPVAELIGRIGHHWKNETVKAIKFPIFTRIGRIKK